MNFVDLLKKYSFHIIALFTFVFFTFFKFIPFLNVNFLAQYNNDNNFDYNLICEEYINDNAQDFVPLIYNKVGELCELDNTCILENGKLVFNKSNEENEQSNSSKMIFVDLSGAVKNPGVYSLKEGSRVSDLINLGDGFTNNASSLWISRNLNLSNVLYDMQKLYVPYKWETYGNCDCIIDDLYINAPLVEDYSSNNNNYLKSSNNENNNTNSTSNSNINNTERNNQSDNLTNLNTANLENLDLLDGIGPAYAQKIIDNRPYTDLSEFKEKSNIPETTITKILEYITF